MQERTVATLGKLVMWALILVTIAITPWWALDPINPIKMLAVSATAFVGLGVLTANSKTIAFGRYKVPLMLTSGFMAWQLLVFFLSGGGKLQQLFGSVGRNTGLVTYLAFSILFVVSMAASTPAFLNRFLFTSLAVGVASLAYSVIQTLGRDPFNWVNPYSPVFGFLGNPNFQSSLIGILGAIVFTQLLSSSVKLKIKGTYLAYLLVSLYVIKETDSEQGFLVLIIGSGVALGIYINQRSRTWSCLYLGLSVVGIIAILLGCLNKGPLASLLFKDSITYRGDYWRAGWNI